MSASQNGHNNVHRLLELDDHAEMLAGYVISACRTNDPRRLYAFRDAIAATLKSAFRLLLDDPVPLEELLAALEPTMTMGGSEDGR